MRLLPTKKVQLMSTAGRNHVTGENITLKKDYKRIYYRHSKFLVFMEFETGNGIISKKGLIRIKKLKTPILQKISLLNRGI